MKHYGKRTIAFLVMSIVLLSVFLTGCSNIGESPTNNNEVVVITDSGGVEVTLPQNVTKIACWSSTLESAVISLGAADKLVCSEYFDESHEWAYLLFPEMKDVEKVQSSDWNAEAIIASGAEVVFVKNATNAENLRNAGLNVVQLDFNTMESSAEAVLLIGTIVGKEEQAKKCADLFTYYVDLVNERLSSINTSEKPSIYYNICRSNTTEPVLTQTYAANFFTTDWIKIAGGIVVTEGMDIGEGQIEINMEELLSSKPDYIFTSGVYQEYTYADLLSGSYDKLFTAVEKNNIIRVPQGVYDWGQAGTETCLVTLWCAKTLYPELFEDIDMVDVAQSFYKDVMGVDISIEYVEAILSGKIGPERN